MYLIRTPEGDYTFDSLQKAQEWVRLLLKTHDEVDVEVFVRPRQRASNWAQQ